MTIVTIGFVRALCGSGDEARRHGLHILNFYKINGQRSSHAQRVTDITDIRDFLGPGVYKTLKRFTPQRTASFYCVLLP